VNSASEFGDDSSGVQRAVQCRQDRVCARCITVVLTEPKQRSGEPAAAVTANDDELGRFGELNEVACGVIEDRHQAPGNGGIAWPARLFEASRGPGGSVSGFRGRVRCRSAASAVAGAVSKRYEIGHRGLAEVDISGCSRLRQHEFFRQVMQMHQYTHHRRRGPCCGPCGLC
jgi:hypothetical protein